MEQTEKKISSENIHDWEELLNQTYSVQELDQNLEDILNQKLGIINDKEEAKMLYMKMLCLIAQTAASTETDIFDTNVTPQEGANRIVINVFLRMASFLNFLEKINPFFEDDEKLDISLNHYFNGIIEKIKNLSQEKLIDSSDLIDKISTTNKVLLSMGWKILFPHRHRG
jgi:hypothetical protein